MPDENLHVGGRAGAAHVPSAPAEGAGGAGRLLVCATPIGNLQDVTLRVLEALAQADVVACEDTRHTRRLLERHGIARGGLVSCHEHNEGRRAGELVERMRAGATVALVSDAGTPLVSDPGYELVRASIAAGLTVEVLPGPSAAVSALVASGLSAQHWRFVGFLPRGGAGKVRKELARLLGAAPETTIAFESPQRLVSTLGLLAELDPEREVVVCRELTKLHEEVRRGRAGELLEYYTEHAPRGEIVLAIGAAAGEVTGSARSAAVHPRHEEALEAVHELVAAGAKPRRAAAVVAKLTGVATNELYRELTGGAQ
ncbi:MAG TPA: 16S rRNA (cytidine(1402)-2'-O)-methyltransferase [Solirubrobacteraceae bacterium]|jgi:16S rRNA (cytidine1402-2'-O)-methyltransferase